MVGGGIAAMHYTGMAAFEVAGTIIWDTTLVVVSILLGAAIGAAALPVGLRSSGEPPQGPDRRRSASDARDLQPSLHGNGRRLDHSRPDAS